MSFLDFLRLGRRLSFEEAVRAGKHRLVQHYLKRGTDPDEKVAGLEGFPLSFAAGRGKCVAVMKVLVEAEADVNIPDESGRTPLHEAASWSYLPGVIFLLSHGADRDVEDNQGWSPVIHAMRNQRGHDEFFRSPIKVATDDRIHDNKKIIDLLNEPRTPW